MTDTVDLDLVNFETWVSQELGPDMVKQLKENSYVNYGQQKAILEFFFDKVYSKKSAMLANLNTRLNDPEKAKAAAKTDRCSTLRAQIKEITQKHNLLKKQEHLEKTEIDEKYIQIKDLVNNKLKPNNEQIISRSLELQTNEERIQKLSQVDSKLKNLTQKMAKIIDSDTEETVFKKEDIESIFYSFIHQLNSKSSTSSVKIDWPKLINAIMYCNTKLLDDFKKLEQIMDAKEIENEIELLKYQLSSSYEDSFESANNDQLDTLEQWIDENGSVVPHENLRIIKMKCQAAKYAKEAEKIKAEIKVYKNRFNSLLGTKYNNPADLKLAARYVISFLELHREEVGLAEVIELEKATRNTKLISLKEEYKNLLDKIDSMTTSIVEKHIENERLRDENMKFFSIDFQIQLKQLKTLLTTTTELIRRFNGSAANAANQSQYAAMSSMSFQLSSTRLLRNPNPSDHLKTLFKAPNNTSLPLLNTQQQQQQQQPLFFMSSANSAINLRLDQLERYLNVSTCVSKHAILSKMITDLGSLNTLLNGRNNPIEAIGGFDEIERSIRDLNELLSRSKQEDERNKEDFFDRAVATLEKCDRQKYGFAQIESLLKVWLTLPAAFQVHFEDYTVNSRTLKYYLDQIDQIISTRNRQTRF